jgi:hypothetical protein
MITTIPEYCKQRNVTRQFVYEYIKKGKFKHYDMPVFIESNGDKIMLGNQKVLEVPEEFAPKPSDALPFTDDAMNDRDYIVRQVTDNPILQDLYRELLFKIPEGDKFAAKAAFDAAIESHPDRDALKVAVDEANIRLMQHMRKITDYFQNVVKEAQKAHKESQMV